MLGHVITPAPPRFLSAACAIRKFLPSEATVIYSLEPLVGAGLASSTLGEPFPSPLGATLVLGGCLLSSLTGSSTNGDGDEIEGQEKE